MLEKSVALTTFNRSKLTISGQSQVPVAKLCILMVI